MMSLLIFQAPHNVVRYELRGDNLNVDDLAFFMVDDITGEVMLRQSVYLQDVGVQTNQYQVSIVI